MEWFYRIGVIWVSLSVLIIATGWYVPQLIRHYWPEWWYRVVADIDPAFKSGWRG